MHWELWGKRENKLTLEENYRREMALLETSLKSILYVIKNAFEEKRCIEKRREILNRQFIFEHFGLSEHCTVKFLKGENTNKEFYIKKITFDKINFENSNLLLIGNLKNEVDCYDSETTCDHSISQKSDFVKL